MRRRLTRSPSRRPRRAARPRVAATGSAGCGGGRRARRPANDGLGVSTTTEADDRGARPRVRVDERENLWPPRPSERPDEAEELQADPVVDAEVRPRAASESQPPPRDAPQADVGGQIQEDHGVGGREADRQRRRVGAVDDPSFLGDEPSLHRFPLRRRRGVPVRPVVETIEVHHVDAEPRTEIPGERRLPGPSAPDHRDPLHRGDPTSARGRRPSPQEPAPRAVGLRTHRGASRRRRRGNGDHGVRRVRACARCSGGRGADVNRRRRWKAPA